MSFAPVNSTLILKFLCKIIQTQMALSNDQVWIYDQKRNIPVTSNLWVVVRFLTGRVFGNNSIVDPLTGLETQSSYMNGVFAIDIFSKDISALARKEEIVMALVSQFSQRQQELYAFKIARTPIAFTDLSAVEGPAIPYRFSINVQVQYVTKLQRSVDYYDHFSEQTTPEA